MRWLWRRFVRVALGCSIAACWSVGAQAQKVDVGVRVLPNQGVTFQQISFEFPNAREPNADYVLITANPVRLAEQTGIRRGYVNIDCDAGWIVRNLLVDLADKYNVSTLSRAGIERPFKFSLFNASVEITRNPLVEFVRTRRETFRVTPAIYNAHGLNDEEPAAPPARHIASQNFVIDGANFSTILPNLSNVEAADGQCFPASIANSLQYLENRFKIEVPNDNVPGLSGDNTLVGRLDLLSGRVSTSRADGRGVGYLPMMAGKGMYLDEAELTDSLVHRHQGRIAGGDVRAGSLMSTDDGEQLTFDWICEQVKAENDIELAFSFEDDEGNRAGGHVVRVVGCGMTMGVPWVKYAEDMTQAGEPGADSSGTVVRRAYLVDLDRDGRLNLEATNVELEFAVSESVTDAIRMAADSPPSVSAEGVTNGASFGLGVLSPGAITTAFGLFERLRSRSSEDLRPESANQGDGLPTSLQGATVTIDGEPAPLFFAGPGQINFQIPYEVPPGQASVAITIDDASSTVFSLDIGPAGPGIFLYGDGRGVIQNQDFSLNTTENPAGPGEVIVVYLTGLGALDNPVPTGSPAPATPLSRPVALSSATIGDSDAKIVFLGLTPDFVGLGQANLEMPDLPPGDYPVTITVGGEQSNAALVSIGP